MPSQKRLAVLISGNGSNLQAIIQAIAAQRLDAQLIGVISNRADALGLEKAAAAGIDCTIAEQPLQLRDTLAHFAPDLIALAGFMRVLDAELVQTFSGRIFNIHPALLPNYKGLHTHARVLASGDAVHGCSVHFVTEALDAGPVVMQARVPVMPDDTVDTLAQRVLECEHIIYPQVLALYCQGRLRMDGERCVLDGKVLSQPLLLKATAP